jgi:hypothetical protein
MNWKGFEVTKRCPHCRKVYTIGLDGTIDGCDECEGIARNPKDGTIINGELSALFEDDELTDMEKS